MSGSMDDRRKGFESKFAHDEELRFKVMARRNRLLGLWAAGENGLSGQAAEDYARTVVAADFQEAGDEDVFRKIRGDVAADKASDHAIRRKMEELLVTAGEQVLAEKR